MLMLTKRRPCCAAIAALIFASAAAINKVFASDLQPGDARIVLILAQCFGRNWRAPQPFPMDLRGRLNSRGRYS